MVRLSSAAPMARVRFSSWRHLDPAGPRAFLTALPAERTEPMLMLVLFLTRQAIFTAPPVTEDPATAARLSNWLAPTATGRLTCSTASPVPAASSPRDRSPISLWTALAIFMAPPTATERITRAPLSSCLREAPVGHTPPFTTLRAEPTADIRGATSYSTRAVTCTARRPEAEQGIPTIAMAPAVSSSRSHPDKNSSSRRYYFSEGFDVSCWLVKGACDRISRSPRG